MRNRFEKSRASAILIVRSSVPPSLTRLVTQLSPAPGWPIMGDALTAREIDALLQRRDKIVSFFEKQAAEKGEDAVLFP